MCNSFRIGLAFCCVMCIMTLLNAQNGSNVNATQEALKERKKMPYSTLFTVNVAYSPMPQWSYGFKFGGVKRVGWFINLMSNFNLAGYEMPFFDGEEYCLTGATNTIRLSAQAGLIIRPCPPFSLLLGAGYGYRALTYEVIAPGADGHSQNHYWCTYPERTYRGVDVSFGFLFNIMGFALTTEAVTTNFKTIEARVGMGICLPYGKQKKQTAKTSE
ncbi:MAG: hypothetical protein IJK22_03130 [Bacteroidales bacterium]|nr:hypothetical protein [Bacteroidales bacterium]